MKGIITCPYCKRKQKMEIPLTVCLPFYKCNACNKLIKAVESCCVFCDYGDAKCLAAKSHNIINLNLVKR